MLVKLERRAPSLICRKFGSKKTPSTKQLSQAFDDIARDGSGKLQAELRASWHAGGLGCRMYLFDEVKVSARVIERVGE